MSSRSPDWPALISQKLALRDSRIPAEWRLPENIVGRVNRESTISALDLLNETTVLTEKERHITEAYDATTLLEKLASGALTSLEVTTAFCKRAAIAHQLTNPLTEIFFDKALVRAKECDAFLAQNGRPMGPFHGLPISLKDMFMVKGEFATLGFVAYLQKPAADFNSVIVDVLLDGGAVFYCKTTVPQGLFTIDSENQVFGCALNWQRLCLTSGGSSSGEGALVGFRGSPLGIGTDIGGSIRCPSLLNACYGFKPTSNRIPFAGQQYHFPEGWPGVVPAAGPHANSARDLTMLCKGVIQSDAWKRDATMKYAPWRDVPRKQKLRVGLWLGVDEMPVDSSLARTLREAADALRAAGHEVVPIVTPEDAGSEPVIGTYFKSLNLDTEHTLMKVVDAGNEQILPALAGTRDALESMDTATLADVWTINANRNRIAAAWHGVLNSLDALLCPGNRSPGALHGEYGLPFYTLIWNLLDCPASVVPFLKVDKTIDSSADDEVDVGLMDGVACHVQLVGWTGQDEEILMATEVVSDVLARYQEKPRL